MDYNEQWDFDWLEEAYNSMNESLNEITESISNDDDVICVEIQKKDENCVLRYPISSDEKYMKDKKLNYKLLGMLTLLSKHNPNENHRYIYHKDVLLNKDMFETLSKNKMDTIIRNIKKLTKIEGDLVVAKTTEQGIVYEINFMNEDGRKYVLIEEDILKKLMTFTNNHTLKIYILLKYRCGIEGKIITRSDICYNIGLSPQSHKNLEIITEVLKGLEQIKLINIQEVYDKIFDKEAEKEQIRKLLKINVNQYEVWKEFDSKSDKKVKGSYDGFIKYNFK